MANRKTNLTNAFETQLSSEMGSVATSMNLDDATGLTAPFYVVIEPASGSQREYVYCDTLVGTTAGVSERYLAGSAAGSGLTHAAGSVVRMVALAQHIADANDRIDDLQAQVNSAGDHGGQTGLIDDDHTQYLNVARHDADDHSGADHGLIAGLADDDHPHYLNTARHDVTARHGSAAVDHGLIAGLADDDHTQYLNAARHSTADHSSVTGAAIGDIKMTALDSAPSGWLLCRGQAISRTTYSDLFAAINVTYGAGDGSTTFNIPNLQQRFPLGKAASGTGSVLGGTGGSIDHAHTQPTHTHSFSGSSGSSSHSHSLSGSVGTAAAHTHGNTFGPSGTGAFPTGSGATAASSAHTHSTDSGGSHSHTMSGTADSTSHSHTVSGSVGTASPTTNTTNPPFLAVNFLIYSGV